MEKNNSLKNDEKVREIPSELIGKELLSSSNNFDEKKIINRSKNYNQKTNLELLEDDPYLEPFSGAIHHYLESYKNLKQNLLQNKDIVDFSNGHHFFGFHIENDYLVYREWAPNAVQLFLVGDFNDWDGISHPLKNKGGYWEIKIPLDEFKKKGKKILKEGRVKVKVVSSKDTRDRIPLYINRVIQDPDSKDFAGQIWLPRNFKWTDSHFFKKKTQKTPLIYEAHIGMAQEKEGVGTYKEFKQNILPRIIDAGYNTIQLMGIMEHPYYGSFGYHVSNFFAPSSRFGTPEELKDLINECHKNNISVIMDIVHSHAVKNVNDGINEFDGTRTQFFHPGQRGIHKAWDSMVFNYAIHDVLHFLLSNVKYWVEEFHFDGFRFDGVTSMLYKDHGLGTSFDNYGKYFSDNTDLDALNYLKLANELIAKLNPNKISIAEDMSGMPGMCYEIKEGGVGFDYRLNMGQPDFFEKLPKTKDENVDMWKIWHQIRNRRHKEKNIAYIESHDQALVGGKTVIFRLLDKEIYYHMTKEDQNIVVDRGISLHKIYRLLCASLGGEGYLNFMGNEFGHPEWIDFPREGNNWSYKYANRKWSLVDRKDLKYHYLDLFDKDMIDLLQKNNLLESQDIEQLYISNDEKILVYRRSEFIFAISLNPHKSFEDFKFKIDTKDQNSEYKIVLNSDDKKYLGHDRINSDMVYKANNGELSIYLPTRTIIVFKKIN